MFVHSAWVMEKLEKEHVKEVYEIIADHFSGTRYKAWPVVEAFFLNLQAGYVGLDVGCGNGKNMVLRKDVITLGFDLYELFFFYEFDAIKHFRSWNLLEICKTKGLEAIYGNMINLPFKDTQFVRHPFCLPF